jgi:hypothetical protein
VLGKAEATSGLSITKKFTRIDPQSSLRQPQGFCEPLLDRGFGTRLHRIEPVALDQGIFFWHVEHGGQIELALNQPPRSLLGVALRPYLMPVHLQQATAYHRIQRRVADTVRGQLGFDQRLLLWLDIDHEMIRRIRWRGLTPRSEQIFSHQREQQQRHQAQRKRHDL